MNQQYLRHNGKGNQPRATQHAKTPGEYKDWGKFTQVEVFVSGLPAGVRTVDVHRNLRHLGNIVRISLKDNRSGHGSRNAEVVFKPPPAAPIWEVPSGYPFKLEDGTRSNIKIWLSGRQRKNFSVDSPSKDEVTYNEELVLEADSIDFGILRGKDKMTVIRSVKPMWKVQDGPNRKILVPTQMILNLRQMQIEVKFPVYLCSDKGDRVRHYRFFVALDANFSIWQISETSNSASYILHVPNPPWYSRRLEQQVAASHIDDARLWREDDMWTRQTDIVHAKEHFRLIDQTPVSIRKNINSINIARWTTFKINLSEHANAETMRSVENALVDFNVNVMRTNKFTINHESVDFEASYWSLLPAEPEVSATSALLADSALFLPFEVRYQLEVCISLGWISEYDIADEFLKKLKELPLHKAKQMLIHVDSFQERVFDPMAIFTDIKYQKPVKARQLPANCTEVHHVTVTATGLKLYSPTVEQSNRVIRRYRGSTSHFLRVRFEDDDYKGQTKLHASSNNKMVLVFARVKRAMRHGIFVAGRHYEFLAWGNSQLREHGCYFFSSDEKGLNASRIRAEMGAFDNEKIVAKRAARMGQCFSTTSPIPVRIPVISRESCIPDITVGKYTFTDGVGKISVLLANLVQQSLRIPGSLPSCFQFRLGGCKGVLTVDPNLPNIDLQVRASQFKFDSTSNELEIIRWSQFWQPFLNRQLIVLLSDLDISDKVFLKMQKDAVRALDAAIKDDTAALHALRNNVDPNRVTLTMCDMVTNGFRNSQELFVMSILNLWRAWSMKYLKEKAKIPVAKGCFVLGVVDETATLRGHYDRLQPSQHAPRKEKEEKVPEIFVQITDPQTGKRKIVEGICILARNPSLHKGDIRIVKAVDAPGLRHLCDVVVMPQTGDRDLPSMCSGGDLDGDDYIVCWDENLIPPIWNVAPFHYDAPTPVAVEGEITTEQIINFYHDYLQNDFLGHIAHAHMGAADYYDDGVDNEDCLELVGLHSKAVDYPKTGVPALLPRRLERSEWPHFMEKRGRSYKSWKVLGQLYDAIQKEDLQLSNEGSFDDRILNFTKPSIRVLNEAKSLKYEYDIAMQQIMAQHKIRTEFEVWSTFVLDHSKASRDFKFHEEIGALSQALKERFHQAVVDVCNGNTFQDLSEFAVAAYRITAEEFMEAREKAAQETYPVTKTPFISFPWLLADILGKIASMSSLNTQVKQAVPATSTDLISATGAVDDSYSILVPIQTAGPDKKQSDTTESNVDASPVSSEFEIVNHPTSAEMREEKQGVPQAEGKSQAAARPVVIDPFKGIWMNVSKQKAARKQTSVPQQLRIKTGSGSSTSGSFVQVSASPIRSVSGESTENVARPAAEPNNVVGECADSSKTAAVQYILLDVGQMKDPALMTAEELAALGLDDDDF